MNTQLWGPEPTTPNQTPTTPERRWGAGSVAMVTALLITTQIALAIGFTIYTLTSTTIDLTNPEATDQLLTEITNTLTSGPGLIIALLVQWVAFIGGPWAATHWFGLKSLARDYGLRFTRNDIYYGLTLAITLQAAQYVVTTNIDLTSSDNTNMVTDNTGIWLILMLIGACIITPLAEELFFRGLLLRAIMRTRPGGWWPVNHHGEPTHPTNKTIATIAIITTSTIFGSLHVTTDGNLANSLPLMAFTGALGAIFAITTIKTKRLGAAIIGHCGFNTISIIAVLAQQGRIF